MIEFRVVPHSSRPVQIVEVWDGEVMLATITPGEQPDPNTTHLRVFSKYLRHSSWLCAQDGVGIALITLGRMQ